MQADEPKSAVIKRILARLPPSAQAKNLEAVKAVAGDEDVPHTNFDFQEVECSASGNKFLATPYTQSESKEGAYRSPFSGHYEPGQVAEPSPMATHPKFKDIENILNSIMQTYMKMYFGGGTGSFYAMNADENTLRGLFVHQSTGRDSKKVKKGSWKTVCPVICTVDESQKVSIMMNHSFKVTFESESKYYGTLSYVSTEEKKYSFEILEKEKYSEKDKGQIYVKHMGRCLEDLETRILTAGFDINYPRISDVICQCRQLQENNEFFTDKKKLIQSVFK